jgi:hypothetical protein
VAEVSFPTIRFLGLRPEIGQILSQIGRFFMLRLSCAKVSKCPKFRMVGKTDFCQTDFQLVPLHQYEA